MTRFMQRRLYKNLKEKEAIDESSLTHNSTLRYRILTKIGAHQYSQVFLSHLRSFVVAQAT